MPPSNPGYPDPDTTTRIRQKDPDAVRHDQEGVRAPHRSLLKAAGVTDADMGKPFIAMCNSFVEIVPGHVYLNRVGRYVKACVRETGGVAFEFNTIGVDDGVSRGHRGGWIRLDIPARKLESVISEAELAERQAKWRLLPKEKPDGCLGKYAAMANSASTGAVLKRE